MYEGSLVLAAASILPRRRLDHEDLREARIPSNLKMILSSLQKETPMFPLFRNFLKFAAAGAFVALSASNPAGADEVVQNLGPVGPNDTLLATVGGMRVIAFLESGNGRCGINAVVWDNDADPSDSAKRVRVRIASGEFVHIDNALQEAVHLQCGTNASTLAIIDTEALSASGITVQPPLQPVKPSP